MEVGQNFTSIRQIQDTYLQKKEVASLKTEKAEESFQDIFKEKAGIISNKGLDALRFSKHAGERLADRNINLTKEQLERLEEGARRAQEKGIHDSLVIMDDISFIVNIKNKTVITAMDTSSKEENVYTNIDGAVII